MANDSAQQAQIEQILAGRELIKKIDSQQGHMPQTFSGYRGKIKKPISKGDIPTTYADFDINFQYIENSSKQPLTAALKNYTPMIMRLNINKPPPELEFLINPKSMVITLNHMSRPQFTRSGWIIQYPGMEMPSMDFTGNVGAFYNSKNGLVGQHYGYDSSTGRLASASYQWLLKMLAFYKNNGCNFNADDRLRIDSVGSVEIFYEGLFYIGSFRTFEFNEDENRPHTIDYSFNFKVREIR